MAPQPYDPSFHYFEGWDSSDMCNFWDGGGVAAHSAAVPPKTPPPGKVPRCTSVLLAATGMCSSGHAWFDGGWCVR